MAFSAAHAAEDPTFTLTATAQDFDRYFPTYLGNGYFSTMSSPRGTEGNLAYMVGLMDYGKDDVSRPAAIPGWTEIDYSTGDSKAGHFWMNQVALDANAFADYRQTLDMHAATLTTSYRYDDHGRNTAIEVVTFVSQASPHLAATRLSHHARFRRHGAAVVRAEPVGAASAALRDGETERRRNAGSGRREQS